MAQAPDLVEADKAAAGNEAAAEMGCMILVVETAETAH